LANILGLERSFINHDEGCVNAQKRLQYLLRRFVEVISSTFAAPVTLFLDDLQWADPASIEAVNQLLLTCGPASPNTSFFFLGCYREGESSCNPYWRAMCNSNLLNGRSTNIKLDCMGEDTVNTMVSETLRLSPRLTRALSSIIYHKTKGNPLFVSQVTLSLSKDGLLRPSLIRGRWEWDKEKILCQKLPDDVAKFLTHSIGKLPEDVKTSLSILSCFGASIKLTGTGTDEEQKYVSPEEQNILATNSSVMTTYYYHKTYISFMFRSYDDTKHYTEKYLACINNTWANLLFAHAFQAF
jgi:predicted ATPase